jgi:hypothetical protein
MAYNPRMFERVYGYDLLDTLHNFYPELMYDNTAFPGETLSWMRYRTSQLFPEQFVHNQNNYRLFQAHNRQTELNNWRRDAVAPQVPPGFAPVQPTIRTFVIPNPRQPDAEQNPQVRIRVSNYEDIVQQLFQPNANSVVDILNLFATSQPQDVIVAPTHEQIEAGSIIVPPSEITDASCAICQEDADSSWRKLYCTHCFHKSCVDRWFERDVHCPVCRADIREPQ